MIKEDQQLRIPVKLPASGSIILKVCNEPVTVSKALSVVGKSDAISHGDKWIVGPLEIEEDQLNTLVLDYCDLKVGSNENISKYQHNLRG